MRWNKGASNWHTFRLVGAATLLLLTSLSARSLLGQNAPGVAPSANQPPVPVQPAPAARVLLIMIDPAHGGSEPGAVLNPAMPEKDVTLAIARRLRQELAARGIQALLLRDSDATISTDQRAQIVNSARPALYVAIHTTSQGSGMRIYTAMLPAAGDLIAPLRPLNNLMVPALAVEIAPTTGDVSQLASADYQQMITATLANGIAAIRAKLETAP